MFTDNCCPGNKIVSLITVLTNKCELLAYTLLISKGLGSSFLIKIISLLAVSLIHKESKNRLLAKFLIFLGLDSTSKGK